MHSRARIYAFLNNFASDPCGVSVILEILINFCSRKFGRIWNEISITTVSRSNQRFMYDKNSFTRPFPRLFLRTFPSWIYYDPTFYVKNSNDQLDFIIRELHKLPDLGLSITFGRLKSASNSCCRRRNSPPSPTSRFRSILFYFSCISKIIQLNVCQ